MERVDEESAEPEASKISHKDTLECELKILKNLLKEEKSDKPHNPYYTRLKLRKRLVERRLARIQEDLEKQEEYDNQFSFRW